MDSIPAFLAVQTYLTCFQRGHFVHWRNRIFHCERASYFVDIRVQDWISSLHTFCYGFCKSLVIFCKWNRQPRSRESRGSSTTISKSVCNKCIAVRKLATPLRELTWHMGSHSVTCHPTEVTFHDCAEDADFWAFIFIFVWYLVCFVLFIAYVCALCHFLLCMSVVYVTSPF